MKAAGSSILAALLLGFGPSVRLCAQVSGVAVSSLPDPTQTEDAIEYICPMDKDVRSKTPGKCPRCGMTLVVGLPDPQEFPVKVTSTPKVIKAGADTRLDFLVQDPKTFKPVQDFELVHERLYHLFVVSQDLKTFVHTHPQKQPDASFRLDFKFPKPGLYRVLSDFYPKGATPQLIPSSVMVPGPGFKLAVPTLDPDVAPQHAENLDVDLQLEPPQPIVGEKTLMFFHLRPNDGIEPYIGAMGHMLAASADLIDMIHTHPFLVTDPNNADYKQIQFNMIFPRAGVYRVWIQFQRKGVVNTVAFNVPVSELK